MPQLLFAVVFCYSPATIIQRNDERKEGCRKGRTGKKGFRTGEMLDRRNTGQERYETGGMQDMRDAGLEGCWTEGMLDRRDTGLERCRTIGLQDWMETGRDTGDEIFRKRGMQDR